MNRSTIIIDFKRLRIERWRQKLADENIIAVADNLPAGVIEIRRHRPSMVIIAVDLPRYPGPRIIDFLGESEFEFILLFVGSGPESTLLKAAGFSVLNDDEPLPDNLSIAGINGYNRLLNIVRQNSINIVLNTPEQSRLVSLLELIGLEKDGEQIHALLTGDRSHSFEYDENLFQQLANSANFIVLENKWVLNRNWIHSIDRTFIGYVNFSDNRRFKLPLTSREELIEHLKLIL